MDIFELTNTFLEEKFQYIEVAVPPPKVVKIGGYDHLRYVEKSLEQAVIQKLARYISGLNASLLLLRGGYTQEVGAIFRMLDEFNEDIVFLSLPLLGKEKSRVHAEYLDSFYQEEFDNPNNAVLSTQNRPTVGRNKVRSYIAKETSDSLNSHDQRELSRTLSQAYSGYVHGASNHILEMMSGLPESLKYNLRGMPQTKRQSEFFENYWDYSYRGIVVTICVENAFNISNVANECYQFIEQFQKVTQRSGQGYAEKEMKRVKRKHA